MRDHEQDRPRAAVDQGTAVKQIWEIDPRDPIVLGDGRTAIPFVEGPVHPFPFPGTIAGMVRSTFVRRKGDVSPADARDLLRTIRIRGPWLVAPRLEEADALSCIRVPAPTDVRVVAGRASAKDLSGRVIGGRILEPGPEEGVLWPEGSSIPALVELQDRNPGSGRKMRPIHDAFWPLDLCVLWSLGLRPSASGRDSDATGMARLRDRFDRLLKRFLNELDNDYMLSNRKERLLNRERRIHVALDDKTLTAEAGFLFSSSGLRLAEGWRIAVEVQADRPDCPDGGDYLGVLGGESRLSYLRIASVTERSGVDGCGNAFPSFERYRPWYRALADWIDGDCDASKGEKWGLRVQLVTPAFCPREKREASLWHEHGEPAWCPSWLRREGDAFVGVHPSMRIPELEDIRLRLYALSIPGFSVVSGWNLQGGSRARRRGASEGAFLRQRTGAPREVRRLVPAGSVYFFEIVPPPGKRVSASQGERICALLWGGHLDPEGPREGVEANLSEFRAPSSHDATG